jgi:hypothetical protein
MSASGGPGPERHGGRRQPDMALFLLYRWAQLAMQRPWRYAAAWAIAAGATSFGLRVLLNDLSLARNAGLAMLTAVGFSGFACLYAWRITRSFPRQWPWLAAKPATPKDSCAASWRSRLPGRQAAGCRSARSQGLWSCPRRVEGSGGRVSRPSGQASGRRRLVLAAVGVAVILTLLVGAIPRPK